MATFHTTWSYLLPLPPPRPPRPPPPLPALEGHKNALWPSSPQLWQPVRDFALVSSPLLKLLEGVFLLGTEYAIFTGLPNKGDWFNLTAASKESSSPKSMWPNPLNSPVSLSKASRIASMLLGLKCFFRKFLMASSVMSQERLPIYTDKQPSCFLTSPSSALFLTLGAFALVIFRKRPPLHYLKTKSLQRSKIPENSGREKKCQKRLLEETQERVLHVSSIPFEALVGAFLGLHGSQVLVSDYNTKVKANRQSRATPSNRQRLVYGDLWKPTSVRAWHMYQIYRSDNMNLRKQKFRSSYHTLISSYTRH